MNLSVQSYLRLNSHPLVVTQNTSGEEILSTGICTKKRKKAESMFSIDLSGKASQSLILYK